MLDFDFHCHTTASDGTLTAEQVIERAARAGVRQLAITDHDCCGDTAAYQQIAASHGVKLFSGVEISCSWLNNDIHIVGLNFRPDAAPLAQLMAQQRQRRLERSQAIAQRLEKHGFKGALQGAEAIAGRAELTRPHFAQWLINEGHCKDQKQAFSRWLAQSKPAYVPMQWCSVEEAVDAINRSGGIAVVAHPARYDFTRTKLKRLLDVFAAAQGGAIEVLTLTHDESMTRFLVDQAKQRGLAGSAGSDFHGSSMPWLDFGRLP
ncbi:MAG TPA: PHP domain-containing protein, partial [Pseudomonadales bacterium]|nr:PHP domain-containing protein [Pseudomonadales bacterium]